MTPQVGRVQITVARVLSHVELAVSDSDIGIASHLLPRVSQRFRQSDHSSARDQQGLGLELALVEQLVELYGHTVSAASGGEDQGPACSNELPLSPDHLKCVAGNAHPRSGYIANVDMRRLEQLIILVVDDQSDAAAAAAATRVLALAARLGCRPLPGKRRWKCAQRRPR